MSFTAYATLTTPNTRGNPMYIIPIAWLYVAVMMSLAEATSSNGTVLGAIITFLLYGLLPIGLILYFIGAPARKRAIRAREAADRAQQATPLKHSPEPDAGSEPATDPVSTVGKET